MQLIFFSGISFIFFSWGLSIGKINSTESFDILSLTINLTVLGICWLPRGDRRYKACWTRNRSVSIMGRPSYIPQVFLWPTLSWNTTLIYIIIIYHNQVLITRLLLAIGILFFASWVEPYIFGILFRNWLLLWLFINELIIGDGFL